MWYNLSEGQQTAVEHYLNVTAFPTYKRIDQQGRVLDVNADPCDLNALKSLVKRLYKK